MALELAVESMHRQVYSQILSTRGSKYKWFIRALRSFRYLSGSRESADFLESYYGLLRYIDDVADGDIDLPEEFESAAQFVEDKIRFTRCLENPEDLMDYWILHCLELGRRFGEDFQSETIDILSSLLFDANRRGKSIIFPAEELDHHFYMLDIRGTVKATLKVFGEDPSKSNLLAAIGRASRIYYNLRDYEEDIQAGFVNISREDCERYGISGDDLKDKNSESVRRWLLDQAELGLRLLDEHRTIIQEGKFGLMARVALPFVYEMPASRYFKEVIRDYKHLGIFI